MSALRERVMRVSIGADHGGFSLKEELVSWLENNRYEVEDVGAHALDSSDDYPDFAVAVSRKVASGAVERGIVVCGSGVGASVAANKVPGVRASLCHDTYSAHQGVEHDDINVLCMGARIIGVELAKEVVTAFLASRFTNEERHRRRLNKVLSIEAEGIAKEIHCN